MPGRTTSSSKPPAPVEVVARVEADLRERWWRTTLLISAPIVLAVLLGYVTAVQVRGGDTLALLFPGVVVAVCAWVGVRLLQRTLSVRRAEAAMSPERRRQAVYVRGLSGTHRLAARQDPDGFAVLDPIWTCWEGTVAAVHQAAGGRGGRAVFAVDVRGPGQREARALLAAPAAHAPVRGATVRVLEDPHHPRAVVDLRATRSRSPATQRTERQA